MRPGFTFLNYNPKPELIAYKQKLLNYLWEKAPSDSILDGQLEAGSHGFRAKIRIVSSEFRYTAEKIAATPREAMEKAARTILKRINEWGLERYKKLICD